MGRRPTDRDVRDIEALLLRRISKGGLQETVKALVQRNILESKQGDDTMPPLWADLTPLETPRGRIGESYRKGGKPLYDTGRGFRGVFVRVKRSDRSVEITVFAPAYMVKQSEGFTNEDGVIYLTVKARNVGEIVDRVTGKLTPDAKKRKLERGVDYWVTKRPSVIPPRPFARLGSAAMGDLRETLYSALGRSG